MNSISICERTYSRLSNLTQRRITATVRMAETVLRTQYAGHWADAEINIVFVHFLRGLVTEMFPDVESQRQLRVLRHLAGLCLSPEAVNKAMHAIPPAHASVPVRAPEPAGYVSSSAVPDQLHIVDVARAIVSAERIGRCRASGIRRTSSDYED